MTEGFDFNDDNALTLDGFDDERMIQGEDAVTMSDKESQSLPVGFGKKGESLLITPIGFGFLNNDSFENFSKRLHQIADDLAQRTQGWEQRFEDQRIGIGMGYKIQNILVRISKEGIKAVRRRDIKEVLHCVRQFKQFWTKLGSYSMPGYKSWEFDSEAGQEIKEFQFVAFFYIYLVGLPESEQLITLDDLWHEECDKNCNLIHVGAAVFLHGFGDAMSELGKMLAPIIVQELSKLAEGERFVKGALNLRKRFIAIAEMMYALLERFETVYEMVMKATLRPGYGNTYRALLGRLSGIICREYERIAETMQQIEYQKWNVASTREAISDEAREAVRDELTKYFRALRERQE